MTRHEEVLASAKEGHESGVTVALCGIYGTICCGESRPLDRGEKFPHCPKCGNNTTWTLERATE